MASLKPSVSMSVASPERLFEKLAESLTRSKALVHSVYSLPRVLRTSQYHGFNRVVSLYPEFLGKLHKKFPEHPVNEIQFSKSEKDTLGAIQEAAAGLAQALQPAFDILQEIAKFQRGSQRLLADLHQLLLPLTVSVTPQLIEYYMQLFCNCVRITFLMSRVPWRTVLQLYTVASQALIQQDPPGRSRLADYIISCDNPIPMLQQRFQPISGRITQVLEVVVNPILDHICAADTLIRTDAFATSRIDHNQMGITGLSQERTFRFLQNADDYRDWALFGFMTCPASLKGVGSMQLLNVLLQETILLPIYKNVMKPVHVLFEAAGCGLEQGWLQAAWKEAATSAKDEHALRRLHMTRQLQDIADLLMDQPAYQATDLPMVLAAMAYGRSELMWYFRHVNEPLQAGPAVKLALGALGQQPEMKVLVPEDPAVMQLLSALVSVEDGLVRYRDVICLYHHQLMQSALVKQLVPSLEAIRSFATGKGGVREELQAWAGPSGQIRTMRDDLLQVLPTLEAVVGAIACLTTKHQLASSAAEQQREARVAAAGSSGAGNQQARSSYSTSREQPPEAGVGVEPSGHASPLTENGEEPPSLRPALSQGIQAKSQQQHSEGRHDYDDSAVTPLAAEHAEADELKGGPGLPEYAKVVGAWVCLTGQVCCTHSPIRSAQLELPAKDPRFMETMNKLLDVWPFVEDTLQAFQACCSLEELLHHQDKLTRLQQAVLEGNDQTSLSSLEGCMAPLKAVHWFEANAEVDCMDSRQEAESMANKLLEAAAGAAGAIVAAMVQERGLCLPMLNEPLPDAPALELQDSNQEGCSDQAVCPSYSSFNRLHAAGSAAGRNAVPGTCARPQQKLVSNAKSTQSFTADTGVTTSSRQLLLRASLLAQAMDRVGPVRVSSNCVVVPREWLREALQAAVQILVSDALDDFQGAPPPSQLAARLSTALYVVSAIQETMSIDLLPDIWTALLLQCQPRSRDAAPERLLAKEKEEDAADTGAAAAAPAPAAPRIMDVYADWYLQHIIKDVDGLGVMFAPQLHCFTCVHQDKKSILQKYTGLAELAALFQVFGPYAAQVLAAACEQTIMECLGHLDVQLDTLQEVLDPIMTVLTDPSKRVQAAPFDSCVDTVSSALKMMDHQAQVLTSAKLLGRCIAFRQLLSEALLCGMQSGSPLMALLPTAGASTSAGVVYDPARHIADVFELPRPAERSIGAPVTADPFVVHMLIGNNSYERYRRWSALPVLLGLSLSSVVMRASHHDLVQRSLDNELHAMALAAQSLAISHQEAANKMLNCGSKFLHPESSSQAQDMLQTFCTVASTVMYLGNDTPAVRTCKAIMLQGLSTKHVPQAVLQDVWLPVTRRWSSMMQPANSKATPSAAT